MTSHPELRQNLPKRVVITGGMPYGNKDLHFGHIGGYFVHADAFSRFWRNRIGAENVLFVSGTDCYGSPIVESHRQQVSKGEFHGTLSEFVEWNHKKQKDVLSAYNIALDLFAASGLDPARSHHENMCKELFTRLHSNGFLKEMETSQFVDPKDGVYLNGRQVLGRCPVPGCKSEKAYADECDLGHPYDPSELIAPKSTLSGETPTLTKVHNWYLNLPKMRSVLESWTKSLDGSEWLRPFALSGIREFLEPPASYFKKEQESEIDALASQLPPFAKHINKNQALVITFSTLEEREQACTVFQKNSLRFRNGKTLLPFRLTGNVTWGVPAPKLGNEAGVATFWVWPESLWAPLSFTNSLMNIRNQELTHNNSSNTFNWRNWWCSSESQIFQFIGEDNLYFYSLAEVGMFVGCQQGGAPQAPSPNGELQTPCLIVNNHILYFDKKASSSGDLKPPLARELLDYYTSDQLRAHFLALGLGVKSVGFKPKPLNPNANEKEGDPVLKEGNMLCNAFNKAVRTAFYTCHKYLDGKFPQLTPSAKVTAEARAAIVKYESLMLRASFHEVIALLDSYIREINKFWVSAYKPGLQAETLDETLQQALVDTFEMIRVATQLLQPIAPTGCEKIREYLDVPDSFWSWHTIFEPLHFFCGPNHYFKEMESKTDFFPKHPFQFANLSELRIF
jgi:methionyl-tRNA synthetase